MGEVKLLESMNKKLDALIALSAISATRDMLSTEKVKTLHIAGFSKEQISELSGIQPYIVKLKMKELKERGEIDG